MAARTRHRIWVGALAGIAGWWAAAGCASSIRVRTDYDQEAAFGGIRSYRWTDSTAIVRDSGANPFLERRVRRAVDHALQARGLAPGTEGRPDVLVTAFVVGPTPPDTRWRYWSAAPCGPVVSLRIGIGYPYGYGLRHPRWPWRSPYYQYPWGYACGYRVGFGYLWIPLYEAPGDRLPGTLVIDLMDPDSRALLWRGSAEGALLTRAGVSVSQEELDQIATRILREFPPR
jgi:hypothetical protein